MSTPFRVCLIAVAAGVSVMLAAGPVIAQTYGKAPMPGEMGPDAPKNVGFDQKLGSTVPLDVMLYDHESKPVTLRDVIGGKPTILVMHYNRCPKLCNVVIQALLDTLNGVMRSDSTFVAGGPFNLVFVSVDPKETPIAAMKSRQEFHKSYDKRADDAKGVWFLTANHGQGTDVPEADRKIHEIAAAIGYRYALRFQNREYFYDVATGKWATQDGRYQFPAEARSYDYEHSPGIIVLTPEGTVSQYLGGFKFDEKDSIDTDPKFARRDVRMALVSASGGKIGTLADMAAPYCFAYDSVTGHYKFTMRWMAILFTPVYLLVAYIALRTVRQVWREPALAPGESGVGNAHP